MCEWYLYGFCTNDQCAFRADSCPFDEQTQKFCECYEKNDDAEKKPS